MYLNLITTHFICYVSIDVIRGRRKWDRNIKLSHVTWVRLAVTNPTVTLGRPALRASCWHCTYLNLVAYRSHRTCAVLTRSTCCISFCFCTPTAGWGPHEKDTWSHPAPFLPWHPAPGPYAGSECRIASAQTRPSIQQGTKCGSLCGHSKNTDCATAVSTLAYSLHFLLHNQP